MVDSIRARYRKHQLTVTSANFLNLLAFADSRDDASYTTNGSEELVERNFVPPLRRYGDEKGGQFGESVIFGSYDYVFKGNAFLVFIVEGYDGMSYKPKYNYILVALEEKGRVVSAGEAQGRTDELVKEGGEWMQDLHEEILVFNQGYWQKNRELWENIQKAKWEDVILEKEKKGSIIDDVLGFFDSEEKYAEFGVPWKASFASDFNIIYVNLPTERHHLLRATGSKCCPLPLLHPTDSLLERQNHLHQSPHARRFQTPQPNHRIALR